MKMRYSVRFVTEIEAKGSIPGSAIFRAFEEMTKQLLLLGMDKAEFEKKLLAKMLELPQTGIEVGSKHTITIETESATTTVEATAIGYHTDAGAIDTAS